MTQKSEAVLKVRRELIRKIGIDIFIQKMGAKSIHKQDNYELLSIDLDNQITNCRYLKMKNPSIQTWHVEGVHRKCNTVQEALNWRAETILKDNEHWKPKLLT